MAASTCPPCPTRPTIPKGEFSSPPTLIPTLVQSHPQGLMILPAIAMKKKSVGLSRRSGVGVGVQLFLGATTILSGFAGRPFEKYLCSTSGSTPVCRRHHIALGMGYCGNSDRSVAFRHRFSHRRQPHSLLAGDRSYRFYH